MNLLTNQHGKVEMRNVPKKIYLVTGLDEKEIIGDEINFEDLSDVTWCEDPMDHPSFEYVLASRKLFKNIPLSQEDEAENEDDIYGIINWWHNLPEDFIDTKTLIYKRRKLSAMYNMMSKFLMEQKKLFSIKKSQHEMAIKKFSSAKQKEIKDGTEKYYSQAAANELAEMEYEPLGIEIAEIDGIIDGTETLMFSVKDTLHAMQQEISVFKNIKEDSDLTETDQYSSRQQRSNTH